MSKQIKTLASGIAALGRGEDKMLVHMTPREVAGLQKLALASGGSLTINPKTGLLEAGWLSTLLPMVAGAAATVLSGGTATPLVAAAWGAGAGALGAKVEGEDPLTGALMGGLGGYGGGALGGMFQTAGKAGMQAAANTAAQTAAQAGTQGAGVLANAAPAAIAAPGAAATSAPVGSTITDNIIRSGIANTAQAAPVEIVGKEAAKQAFGQGIKGLGNQAGRTAFTEAFKAAPQSQQLGALYAGTAGTMAAADALSSAFNKNSKDKNKNYYYHYSGSMDPVTGQVTFGPGYYSGQYDYANRGMYDPNNSIPDFPYREKAGSPFAAGGEVPANVSGLNALGRYIKGSGDGVSDNIPAMIDGKQPAALSNGEFVVDAQTVSKLGNGASDAGAQRLYAMMERVHRAKTAPGKDINPDAYLPA